MIGVLLWNSLFAVGILESGRDGKCCRKNCREFQLTFDCFAAIGIDVATTAFVSASIGLKAPCNLLHSSGELK